MSKSMPTPRAPAPSTGCRGLPLAAYGRHFAQRGFGPLRVLLPGRVHARTQVSREDRTGQAANRWAANEN
jgi:hypothetical protein